MIIYLDVSHLHVVIWAVARQPSPRLLLPTTGDSRLQRPEEHLLFHSCSVIAEEGAGGWTGAKYEAASLSSSPPC